MSQHKISKFQWALAGICFLALLVDYLPKVQTNQKEIREVPSFSIDVEAQNRHIHFIHKETFRP